MFEKLAYQVGVKLALDTAAASDDLREAAERLYGIAGGLAGAAGGGFLGRYLGREAADAFDLDEDVSGAVGTGLGALAGGGLGAVAGSSLSSLAGQPGEVPEEPASEPEPEYPTAGMDMSFLDQLPQEAGLGLSQPFYDVTPEEFAPEDIYSMGLSGYGNDYGYGGYDDYGYGY